MNDSTHRFERDRLFKKWGQFKIEHKFRELKIFRILSGTYRNFRKKLHMRLNIMAVIVNLKHAF